MHCQICAKCAEYLPVSEFPVIAKKDRFGRMGRKIVAATCKLCVQKSKRERLQLELVGVDATINALQQRRDGHQAKVRASNVREERMGLQ